jgi:large subunit ribosomal protein L30
MSDAPTTSPSSGKKPRARKSARERQTLRLKLVKSGIATPKDQKATIRALGFRRIGDVVERADSPDVRGRIRKIAHLVQIVPN